MDLLGIISFPLSRLSCDKVAAVCVISIIYIRRCTNIFLYVGKMQEHISTVFQESMLHEYCSVCVFVYAVRQGCALCKSLAGASSQPGGQTRKQMDWFGLNPSHAILSSWPSLPPSSSNLHATLCKMKAGQQQSVVLLRGGGEPCLMLLVPRRDGQKTESNLTLPCVSWAVLTHGPCLHV